MHTHQPRLYQGVLSVRDGSDGWWGGGGVLLVMKRGGGGRRWVEGVGRRG